MFCANSASLALPLEGDGESISVKFSRWMNETFILTYAFSA